MNQRRRNAPRTTISNERIYRKKKSNGPFVFIFSLLCFVAIGLALAITLKVYIDQLDMQDTLTSLEQKVDTLSVSSNSPAQLTTPSSSVDQNSVQANEISSTTTDTTGETTDSSSTSVSETETSTEPSQSTPETNEGYYTVQDGDVLSTIADSFGLTTAELMTMNNLEDDVIYAGQELIVE